jgi:hypothetical protein
MYLINELKQKITKKIKNNNIKTQQLKKKLFILNLIKTFTIITNSSSSRLMFVLQNNLHTYTVLLLLPFVLFYLLILVDFFDSVKIRFSSNLMNK